MDKEQIAEFKKLLETERAELLETLSASRNSAQTVELDQSRMGRLSRMDAMQNQSIAQDAVRRTEIQLQKVNDALKRIEYGEFGICQNCFGLIQQSRLEAKPSSTLCMTCISG